MSSRSLWDLLHTDIFLSLWTNLLICHTQHRNLPPDIATVDLLSDPVLKYHLSKEAKHSLSHCHLFFHSTLSLSDMVLFTYWFPCLLVSVSLTRIWTPEGRDFLLPVCPESLHSGPAPAGAQHRVPIESRDFFDDWILSSQADLNLRPRTGSDFS